MLSDPRRRSSYAAALAKTAKSYLAYDPTLKHMREAYKQAYGDNPSPAKPIRAKPAKVKKPKRKPKTKSAKVKKDIKDCKSAIRELKHDTDQAIGTLTARYQFKDHLAANTKQQSCAVACATSTASLESVTTQLKFFDPANPAVLVTASGSAGTYQRNIRFKSITQTLLLRNNYQQDCKVKVYYCAVRDDTDQTPVQAWAAGVTDGGNLTSVNDSLQYPTDYSLFKDLYKTKVVLNTVLSPGQSATCSNTEKDVEYDSATVDTHGLVYQKEYKNGAFLVVIEGTLCHQTTNFFSVGNGKAAVDIISKVTYIVKYNAGININYIYAQDNTTALTESTSVQSHQPVADNLIWSGS